MSHLRGPLAGLLSMAVLAFLPAAAGRVARAQAITVSASDLLEYYEAGEVDLVKDALDRAATGDLGIVLDALRRDTPAWIDADGAEGRERRRLIAATFALEAARAALNTQWDRSIGLIEWAADLLAKGPPTAGERLWHQAALALSEGARDMVTIDAQVARMKRRIPDEPRIALGHAFVQEILFWDTHAAFFGKADALRAARSLRDALSRPGAADEARLRMGYFMVYANRPEEALQYLQQIASSTDAGQVYLAGLFAGWAHERLGHSDEAIRSFRAALAAVPHGRTAAYYLAARLFATGATGDADTIVQTEMLHAGAAADDPWDGYGYGDLRRFPLVIEQLRRSFK